MSAIILRRIAKYKVHNKPLRLGILTDKRNCTNHVIKSALPNIKIPDEPISQFVFKNFSKFPHKIAVECSLTGRKYTYEELRRKSNNLNKSLRKKLKLLKGDVVATLLPNIPEYPICVLGSIEAGLTVTTINPAYTSEEINRQLLDADVKAIFTLIPLWNNAKAAANLTQKKDSNNNNKISANFSTIQNVNVNPDELINITLWSIIPFFSLIEKFDTQEDQTIPEGAACFKELVDSKCDIENLVLEVTNDTVLIPYSSGTTGLPKGVEHTHRSIIATLCQINSYYFKECQDTTDTHQDVIPAVLPLFHIYGLTVILLNKLWSLSKLICLPQFTPELYISCLQKCKPNTLFAVPPLVIFMTKNAMVKTDYFQSTRTVICGAAPLGAPDEESFVQKVGNHVTILQGYGLTESSTALLTSKLKKSELGLSGSVGELLPNAYAKVVPVDNLQGRPLASYTSGELLIKGPHVMKGYHNKPKETNETLLDGWVRTGDLVYYDEDKMFYVVGRLKELIKVKASQVAPAELEEILRSFPEVDDAAVIGIPHVTYGEVPRGYVVSKLNAKIDVEELQMFVNEKVAAFKQIKGGIAVIRSIPKTASGKIVRRELQKLYKMEIK